MEFLTKGGIHVFPARPGGTFIVCAGMELTGHDNSAADIIYICTAAFIVHNMYRYCCIHTKYIDAYTVLLMILCVYI